MKSFELTDNDKQRIEQEAQRLYRLWEADDDTIIDKLMQIAEYATIYERAQSAERDEFLRSRISLNIQLTKKVEQLEAERAELRNKVIELEKALRKERKDHFESMADGDL